MNSVRLSPATQIGVVYALVAVWHGIWIAGLLAGKAFLGGLPLAFGILFFAIPLLYTYALSRIAEPERAFVNRHPLIYFGTVAAAVLPLIGFVTLVLVN